MDGRMDVRLSRIMLLVVIGVTAGIVTAMVVLPLRRPWLTLATMLCVGAGTSVVWLLGRGEKVRRARDRIHQAAVRRADAKPTVHAAWVPVSSLVGRRLLAVLPLNSRPATSARNQQDATVWLDRSPW